MDFLSEGLVIGDLREDSGLARDRCMVTIHMLPDDVLVGIFDFHEYVHDPRWYTPRNTWRPLVHVCRRWRNLVFTSPLRLNLRLVYGGRRPISEMLNPWPVLPISLKSKFDHSDERWDNMVAALESEHSDRISEIHIDGITNLRWERFVAAMQKPFPVLTLLQVWVFVVVPVLPDSFLGGSASRLRSLNLIRVPFPSIPNLLLSAHRLVKLDLEDIPDSGYISPGAMATALTRMTSLKSLHLRFRSPRSRPDPARHPPARFVLPALTRLIFRGVYEYLEDLLARIDAPFLDYLDITFFMDLDFDVPQLHRLIGHAEKFEAFGHANVSIFDRSIQLYLVTDSGRGRLRLQINCRELDYKLSSLTQVCSSSFPFISALEMLQIREHDSPSHGETDMENGQLLELLDPFTSLKDLYLGHSIARRVCSALQELSGERATEVLPALRNFFVQGSSLEPVQEAIKRFVTARQLSDHPVVVDHWKD